MNNKNCLTSSGLVYSYNIPKQYNATTTHGMSCYKKIDEYGSCKQAQIVPPSPTTVTPILFDILKPHAFKSKVVPVLNISNNNYKNYNNGAGTQEYTSDGANRNTNDTYRKISMPNSALSCGGLGKDMYVKKKFEPGFNDVAYLS